MCGCSAVRGIYTAWISLNLYTDWVGTAPVRAWVEWRRLDNASGAADGDGADTTVIDFVSAPLSWVDGMGGGEEDDFSQHRGEASGGGSLSAVCLTLTDWVVTAHIRARVEWIWLDNASGAADEDDADTTDIDFDSSPLLWEVGLVEGEDRRTS